MDEALALPSEEAVQIALRTQQLIAYETGVTDTVDPLAGSFYIEHLTTTIEEKAMDYIRQIDKLGGAAAAIEKGFIQREIQESAFRYQKSVETGDRVVVGINKFQTQEPSPSGLLKVDPAVQKQQIQKILQLKQSRDNTKVLSCLAQLKKTAEGQDNLMPPIIEAVRAYATLGEICDTLRSVFGEYTAVSTL
jgi:methylmalonyl-CoA mutase N-terminal domain/subunit